MILVGNSYYEHLMINYDFINQVFICEQERIAIVMDELQLTLHEVVIQQYLAAGSIPKHNRPFLELIELKDRMALAVS
ncbi:hypothetical protein GCM10028773_19940 [Spirosoma koreense]